MPENKCNKTLKKKIGSQLKFAKFLNSGENSNILKQCYKDLYIYTVKLAIIKSSYFNNLNKFNSTRRLQRVSEFKWILYFIAVIYKNNAIISHHIYLIDIFIDKAFVVYIKYFEKNCFAGPTGHKLHLYSI